jgi:DNA polymerase (family 10)
MAGRMVGQAAGPAHGQPMNLTNEDVASAFDEMADLLAIQGGNVFRIRAYRRAARLIRGLASRLADMDGAAEFASLPGIGTDLAGKIAALLETGRMRALEELRRQVPAGLRQLLRLPGLGPARVRALNAGLGVRSVADLQRVLAQGRVPGLRGFGQALAARLQAAIATGAASVEASRTPLATAAQYAEPLRAYLQSVPGVARVEIAGSYRRARDTVGDLDVVLCASGRVSLATALQRYGELRALTAAGRTKASAVLRNGLQVDVRVVPPGSFGAALYYFTGSRDHNIRLRRRAQQRGLKLNEYGLYRGRKRVAGATEAQLLRALDLQWIPPELREDRGEIEAAAKHALPVLLERGDLRGDLHVHTDASDGQDSLAQMIGAARARGLQYLAVTDHSKRLGIVHGLDAERLARQIEAIDAFNERTHGLVVLKGAEVDILEDGRLALPDAVLRRLDVVVIAVHSHFELAADRQTTRLLRALERPCVSILAHPSGRLLGERPACVFDLGRVLEAARARPCYLEVNGQPQRLDLDDSAIKAARDRGVLLSIASDAHAAGQLDYLSTGVRQARRGWATPADVLNTRSLAELRRLLRLTIR